MEQTTLQAMKFFKVTLTAYSDEKIEIIIIPKPDEYDGDTPIFSEKNLTNTNEFKEFVKRTETPVVTVQYKLFSVIDNAVTTLNYNIITELENSGGLELIDENDYIINNIKVAKGKKKKGGFDIKQYMPILIIVGAALLLLIGASAASKFANNNTPVVSDTTTISETTPVIEDTPIITTAVTPENTTTTTTVSTVISSEATTATEAIPEILEDISVHFIDVGQGDCIYADLPNDFNLLIDSGPNAASGDVLNYLINLGVTEIDYVIATHPHEDHIGGMNDIINSFKIDKFIMPELTENMFPTTESYINMLSALENNSVDISYSKTGTKYEFSDECFLEILAPIKDYEFLNDYSIVTKLTYGDTAYLFTGDIETSAEYDILKNNVDLNSDVLKVAHHGSDTSTIKEFVSAVTPEIAIISVGADNEYGHPSDAVITKLNEIGTNIIRTDENGTTIVKSDGVDVWAEFITEDTPVVNTGSTVNDNNYYESGTYKITFNNNGGVGKISSMNIKAGFNVSLPTEGIEREGYNFIGWSTAAVEGYPVYNYTMPEYDVVLYAVWEAKEYTVTYNSNGGLGLVVPYKVKTGDEVPLPIEGLINGDLVLVGWNTQPDSKSSLKKYFMPNEDITLYAVWAEPTSQAKITLVADGQESSFNYQIGEELNCRDDFGIIKDGYIVSGWTLYDGYGDILQTFTVRGDTTLYATWEEATYINLTIDQSHINKDKIIVKCALDMNGVAKYTLPVVDNEANHRKGYTYGWSTEKNGYIEFYGGEIAKFEKPITVYRVRNMYAGGNGSEENPYIISNWEHIELMSEKGVNGYYKQICDIELPNSYKHNSIKILTPKTIDEEITYDNFVYDGGEYTISNLKSEGGLFDELKGSVVKNIIFDNCNITSTAVGSTKNIGIIANSVNTETFTVSSKTYAVGLSEIRNCIVMNSIVTVDDNSDYVGVVIGYGGNICDTYITNCSISVTANAENVGGISGASAEIYSCAINGLNIEGAILNGEYSIKNLGGAVSDGFGIGVKRKNGTTNYVGCNIYDVAIRNIILSNADNIGGILAVSGANGTSPNVSRCYIANSVLNGNTAGSLVGIAGNGASAHTFSFCIVDETNAYNNIGSPENNKAVLGTQILRVPYSGLMVDGVTYILGENWKRDSNIFDGYALPSSLTNLVNKTIDR